MIRLRKNKTTSKALGSSGGSGGSGAKRGGRSRIMRNISRLINYDLFENIQWIRPDSAGGAASDAILAKGRESFVRPTPLPVVTSEPAPTPAPTPTPTSIPAPRTGELPSVEELYRLFDLYNSMHFNNALPKASIEYSTRMLSAGTCEPIRRRIKIGVRYHQIFREELEDTLKHEMIHLIHFHHDKRFKAKAAELGVPVHAKFHPDLKRPPKYIYHCPECKAQYPRQKRLRETSCGSCSGGRYDKRFKLLLVAS